jgi:hypothetical protein
MLQFVMLIIVMKWKHKNIVTFGTALFKAKRNINKNRSKNFKTEFNISKKILRFVTFQYDIVMFQYDIIMFWYDIVTFQYDIVTFQYDIVTFHNVSICYGILQSKS